MVDKIYVKKISLIFFVIVVVLMLLELSARIVGFRSFNPPWEATHIAPTSPFLEDSILGYKLKTGSFQYYYKNGYSYEANHLDGRRVNGSNPSSFKALVHVYGDSFLYGMGLEDDETMSYILQKNNPEIRFENYAVLGYSLFINYLQFSQNIDSGNTPDYAIFLIAGYDEGRITMNKQTQKNIYMNKDVAKLYSYPYLKKDGNQFSVQSFKLLYRPFLSSKSALFNAVSNIINNYFDRKIDYKEAMSFVLNRIIEKCDDSQTTPIFMYLSVNKNIEDIIENLKARDFITVDVNLDFSSDEFSLLPYDTHPNQNSNRIFAERIQDKLNLEMNSK
jgi:hypothetical protein